MFRSARLDRLERKVDALQQLVIELNAERQFLKQHIEDQRSRLDVLENRAPSSVPLHWSEEEEDLDYLHRIGRINDEQFRDLMQSTGFANTEVEFAPEDYPRISQLARTS